jgi:hypothetical protein
MEDPQGWRVTTRSLTALDLKSPRVSQEVQSSAFRLRFRGEHAKSVNSKLPEIFDAFEQNVTGLWCNGQ